MTREEAKEVFLNRGFIKVNGGAVYDANKWREACSVISEWLEQEQTTKNDLGVNLISKSDVDRIINCPYFRQADKLIQIMNLPSVTFKDQLPTKNDLGVDCISRADAIQAMQDKAKKLTNEDTINGLCGAVAILFDMPSVTPQEPRWIPVSEYLPVTNDEVLVTYIVNGNAKKRYVETANCYDGEWSSVNDEYRIPNTKIEIVAWCEMPKPYKAESEG